MPPVDRSIDPVPQSLAFDPAGNLVIGVRLTLASLDANGAVRWTRDIPGDVLGGWTTLGVTARGTVVAVVQHGMGTLTWAGTSSTMMRYKGTALFLAVAEADGTPRFGRALAGDFWFPTGVSVDPAGRVAILMRKPELCTERLEKWNLAGERLWTRELACGNTGDTWWRGVAVDPVSHHVRVAGGLRGTVDLGAGPVTSKGKTDVVMLDVMP